MGKRAYDLYRYSYIVALIFGIVGNIFVIMSILRQKRMSKNNYYFVVLHLAICDLGALSIYLFNHINWDLVEEQLVSYSTMYCVFCCTTYFFQVAGVGMMLVISVLCYRATVHPLELAISRRKLKVVCGLVYLGSLIAGYGVFLQECFLQDDSYWNFRNACTIIFLDVAIIFMAVVYCKIDRALIKHNKQIESVCSNPVRRGALSSSFNVLRSIRQRRTFLVCLTTALCYGVGNIPLSAVYTFKITEEYNLLMKSIWFIYSAIVLRAAGLYSVNPLVNGILGKKLLTFYKHCHKEKRRPHEN